MAAIPHAMTTTTFVLDGYAVQRTLGVVRGVTVRSRSVLGTIGASLQTLVGGNITLLTELCEKTRADAFQLMLDHAQQLGANAVVGVRYDATEVMQGVTEGALLRHGSLCRAGSLDALTTRASRLDRARGRVLDVAVEMVAELPVADRDPPRDRRRIDQREQQPIREPDHEQQAAIGCRSRDQT